MGERRVEDLEYKLPASMLLYYVEMHEECGVGTKARPGEVLEIMNRN